MSQSCTLWDGNIIDEAHFHAQACVLATVGKQQAPGPSGCLDGAKAEEQDEDDSGYDSDGDTVVVKRIVSSAGLKRLEEKFLDRLAELFSREKPSAGHKAIHVAATAMAEGDDEMIIYIAKNGGFDVIDEQMRKRLQFWIRLVAEEGCRRDAKNDLLWKELLKYYSKRLTSHRTLLRESLQNHVEFLRKANLDHFATKLFSLINSPIAGEDTGGNDGWHGVVCAAYELRYDGTFKPWLKTFVGAQPLVQRIGGRSCFWDDSVKLLGFSLNRHCMRIASRR